MRIIPLIIAAAALFVIILNQNTTLQTLQIKTQDKTYDISVDISNTPEERSLGLMGQDALGEFEGMFFIFEKELIPAFWMKNMKFSLDLVFIGEDNKIKHIIPSVPPCTTSEQECVKYSSPSPVRYVLEVNSGFTEKYGIDIGDEVKLPESY